MKKKALFYFATMLLLFTSCVKEDKVLTEKQAQDFYDYAYPLVMMKISQDAMLSSPLRQDDQLNKFIMFKQLAKPENKAVVLGNRNTLYCVGWVDLSEVLFCLRFQIWKIDIM